MYQFLYKMPLQSVMSNYQIQRILQSNTLKQSVKEQIQGIEHLTEQLTQRSNFMATFQQMLKKQLSHNNYSMKNNNKNTCLSQIKDLRRDMNELSFYFADYIGEVKSEVTSQVTYALSSISTMLQQTYQNKLRCLIEENCKLQKLIQQKHSIRIPFKLEQSKSFSYQERKQTSNKQQYKKLTEITNSKKLQNYPQQSKIKYASIVTEQSLRNKQNMQMQYSSQMLKTDIKWTDYHYGINAIKTERSQNDIPSINQITIGYSPVQQGFGVLRCNNKLIYKGMWKEGKFNGRGCLTLDQCIYEGEFLNNRFNGLGTLKTAHGTYKGQFKNHKANGQGTWCAPQHSPVYGVWKDNKFLMQY